MDLQSKLALSAARSVAEGASNAEVLRQLRAAGATMADCVVALANARSIELRDAQEIVVESDVWADRKAAYLKLESEFWRAAEELGERQPDGSIKIRLRDLED